MGGLDQVKIRLNQPSGYAWLEAGAELGNRWQETYSADLEQLDNLVSAAAVDFVRQGHPEYLYGLVEQDVAIGYPPATVCT